MALILKHNFVCCYNSLSVSRIDIVIVLWTILTLLLVVVSRREYVSGSGPSYPSCTMRATSTHAVEFADIFRVTSDGSWESSLSVDEWMGLRSTLVHGGGGGGGGNHALLCLVCSKLPAGGGGREN